LRDAVPGREGSKAHASFRICHGQRAVRSSKIEADGHTNSMANGLTAKRRVAFIALH
jgi:hypothetical protein